MKLITRAYCINNMYLSGIHAGIQSAHSIAELFVKYPNDLMLKQWAQEDKTIVVLNGGYAKNLQIIAEILTETNFAWSSFHESEEALGGVLTNVCVILDQSIYELQSLYNEIRSNFTHSIPSDERLLEMMFDSASWKYDRIYSEADKAFFKAYRGLRLMGA